MVVEPAVSAFEQSVVNMGGFVVREFRGEHSLRGLCKTFAELAVIVFAGNAVGQAPLQDQLEYGHTSIRLDVSVDDIEIVDSDGDGLVDIVAASRNNGGEIVVFRTLDNGTIAPPVFYQCLHPTAIAIGDVSNDSQIDVVITLEQHDEVQVALNEHK